MNFPTTLALGAVAGGTIVLGLPVGRLRAPAAALRVLLCSTAVGVLLFLVWDVLSAAWGPIDAALSGERTVAPLPLLSVLFVGGITAGLLSVVGYERFTSRRRASGGTSSRTLALLVAIGIGTHNLAEGLAIGQSAASGELGLVAVLVVGFALHNATEGFGIVAPLAADEERPSWPFLLLLGAIGGVPEFRGTGHGFAHPSPPQSVQLLSHAAG